MGIGSLLGLSLTTQLITGLFLSMHYGGDTSIAFESVSHIMRDVTNGRLLRVFHANGASLFFVCLFLHTGRGLYYISFKFYETWIIGVTLLILTIATAFLGYVLPWGQISFWGATVITNLFSAIPYIGKILVEWIWGGFAVDNATLNRFFALHFLLPFVVAAFVILHLLFLHQRGSNNPLGINSDSNKIPFHIYYRTKDVLGFFIMLIFLVIVVLFFPNILGDPENFIPANPLVTPVHIKPEWYFLWAYAILRSIPNKLGGVVAIFSALLILFFVPLINFQCRLGNRFYPINQFIFWLMVTNRLLLTWVGGCPVEVPYEGLGKIFTYLYFTFYFINPLIASKWDSIIESSMGINCS